jgi:hypothetical protein
VKLAKYTSGEKRIARTEGSGIVERWRWGRTLLTDTEKITPAGNLKHGVLPALIAAAQAKGLKLSEREIQLRMGCARAYSTEAEIRTAGADFGSWTELRDAGFPTVELPPGTAPDDATDWAQDELAGLPAYISVAGIRMLTIQAPISAAISYHEEMEQMTLNFVARDAERASLIAELVEAAEGDVTMSIGDALKAARGDTDTDQQTPEQ